MKIRKKPLIAFSVSFTPCTVKIPSSAQWKEFLFIVPVHCKIEETQIRILGNRPLRMSRLEGFEKPKQLETRETWGRDNDNHFYFIMHFEKEKWLHMTL